MTATKTHRMHEARSPGLGPGLRSYQDVSKPGTQELSH
jgi:hypothetical protein